MGEVIQVKTVEDVNRIFGDPNFVSAKLGEELCSPLGLWLVRVEDEHGVDRSQGGGGSD